MTRGEALGFINSTAAQTLGFLGLLAVALLGLSLVGLIRSWL